MAMMSKSAAMAAAAAMAVAFAGAAVAHEGMKEGVPKNASAATKAAYQRHENFEALGKAFKALNDELRKSSPNKAVLAANAKTVNTLAVGLPTWFPRGSGIEARPKSEAKANIWTDAAGFTAAASNLRTEAAKLNAAAASGNVDAVKAQFRPTGAACKACHDKYRQEKKD